MKQPKISVIIPVYNAEKFLNQCLDSVIKQPMKELEIICVNDGSTDSSPQILDDYAQRDSRIRIIHQPNLHAGIARNKGLEAATGEYIHFLDADDYLADNVYDKIYEIARNNQLECLMLKAHLVDALTSEKLKNQFTDNYALLWAAPSDFSKPFTFTNASDRLTANPVYPPWSRIILRTFLLNNKIRFDSLHTYNDHTFYYAVIVRAQRIMMADIYVVFYRINNQNSLVGGNLKRLGDLFDAFNKTKTEFFFLPQREYALVLDAELNHLFRNYTLAIQRKIKPETAKQLMSEFIRRFDIATVNIVCEQSQWYIDYLMVKYETLKSDGMLSERERKTLISELINSSLNTILLPVKELKQNNRVVIYGAGYMGYRVFKILMLQTIVLLHCGLTKTGKISAPMRCRYAVRNKFRKRNTIASLSLSKM